MLAIRHYPIPVDLVRSLVERCERILVFEDGYPYVEGKLRGLLRRETPSIGGRMTGELPRTGELTPDLVARALGRPETQTAPPSTTPAPRPPALCPGCPHADTCNALNEAIAEARAGNARVFSDIGCYTLGALPPHQSIDTCVEMGASITMARGASAAGLKPAVALIGDSTFAHSGMTGLLDCVNDNSDVTVVIVDNGTVGMTGGQPSAADSRLAAICEGLGVDAAHIRRIVPLPNRHDENVTVLKEEIAYDGTSVVIAERECIQTARRSARTARSEGGPS
jgi:indolepyruvate ferredoxin oxidoreductase alpha subunit